MEGARHRRGALALLAVVLVAVVVDQLRILWSARRSLVNSDATLIWAEARDWSHFQFRQRNFYGQGYGSTFDAIPVAVLHSLGVGYGTATPLTLGAFNVAPWLVLAFVAWRRGHALMSLAAVAAPAIFSGYFTLLNGSEPFTMATRLIAVAGAAILLLEPRRLSAEVAGWALMGFALVLDGGTALFECAGRCMVRARASRSASARHGDLGSRRSFLSRGERIARSSTPVTPTISGIPACRRRIVSCFRTSNVVALSRAASHFDPALLAGVPPTFCTEGSRRSKDCRMVTDTDAVVRFAPRSLLAELAALDIAVRPFGPDCHLAGAYGPFRHCANPIRLTS
jgi:hypothetical protein